MLEYSKNNQIDLLICDIDMPIKNGIDLAKELKEFLPNLEIIFLTGMDTFDYIYKANKVKDSKYLLKIEEDETIISTIKDTIQKIEEISMNDKNTLAHAAMKWCYNHEEVSTIIFGTNTAEHLADAVGILDSLSFTDKELEMIETIKTTNLYKEYFEKKQKELFG